MAEIETLTEEGRRILERNGGVLIAQTLRIIDAQAARIAELESPPCGCVAAGKIVTVCDAHAECARLRELLTVERAHRGRVLVAAEEAQAKLAAANALLERRPKCVHGTTAGWERDIRAHLSGAEPAPTRTEAERAVLDAMAAIDPHELEVGFRVSTVERLAVAELARREVKP